MTTEHASEVDPGSTMVNVHCPDCESEAVVLKAGREKVLARWRRDHERAREQAAVEAGVDAT